MIKAAVLGATGYAGIELVRLLTSHLEVSIEILGSHSFAGQKISDVYKNFNHVLEKECEELDLDKVGACDVAFTALPHGASKSVIPSLAVITDMMTWQCMKSGTVKNIHHPNF